MTFHDQRWPRIRGVKLGPKVVRSEKIFACQNITSWPQSFNNFGVKWGQKGVILH